DLAGISHFSGKNYLPLTWSNQEQAQIKSCYSPQAWNEYAFGQCAFVRHRLQEQGLWGSADLWQVWIGAILREPLSYLRHRATHRAWAVFPSRESLADLQCRLGAPSIPVSIIAVLCIRHSLHR